MKRNKAFKFRLYPTHKQEVFLIKLLVVVVLFIIRC